MGVGNLMPLTLLAFAVFVAYADDQASTERQTTVKTNETPRVTTIKTTEEVTTVKTTEEPETTTKKRQLPNFEYKVSQGFEYTYYLIRKKRLWTQAQRICRFHFKGELASHGLESQLGRQQLLQDFSDDSDITEAWLGFQRRKGVWRWEWERADGTPLGKSKSLDGWLMTRKKRGYNYVLVHLYDPLLHLPNIRSTYRSSVFQVYNHYERRTKTSAKQRRYFICEKKNSNKVVQVEQKKKEFDYAVVGPDE